MRVKNISTNLIQTSKPYQNQYPLPRVQDATTTTNMAPIHQAAATTEVEEEEVEVNRTTTPGIVVMIVVAQKRLVTPHWTDRRIVKSATMAITTPTTTPQRPITRRPPLFEPATTWVRRQAMRHHHGRVAAELEAVAEHRSVVLEVLHCGVVRRARKFQCRKVADWPNWPLRWDARNWQAVLRATNEAVPIQIQNANWTKRGGMLWQITKKKQQPKWTTIVCVVSLRKPTIN